MKSRQSWVKELSLLSILPFNPLFFRENPSNPIKKTQDDDSSTDKLKKRLILCSKCNNVLTDDSKGYSFDGDSEYTFKNPDDIYFTILLFQAVEGAHILGPPTKEFSWFHGFFWNYVHCKSCDIHLGWFFQDGKNESFFGLIKTRLKENF